MNGQRTRTVAIVLLSAAALLLVGAAVAAQVGGGYDLSWAVIAGGGGESSGGDYQLTDAAGQAAASQAPSGDGDRFSLTDGFISAGTGEWRVYLPAVLRQ